MKKEVVNQFIINTVLVDPISSILDKLNKGEFRDCDIKWLEKKLNAFTSFAGETLGLSGVPSMGEFKEDFPFMNDYVKKYYSDKFSILFQYFKSF